MGRFLKIFKLISRIVLPKVVVVGMDIQEKHVAMVASSRQADKGTGVISGVTPLEAGTIVDGELKNPHVLYNTLQDLIGRVPIRRLKNEPVIVLSVPPTHMYSEMVLFPLMNSEDLKEAVRLKIETSLPWAAEEAYIDWKQRSVQDPKKMGIFIAAVSKQFLDPYLAVFQKGGWRVAACEFHLLSLAQAGRISGEGAPYVFVLIDEDGVEFAIFNGAEIMTHFVRKLDDRSLAQDRISFETKRLVAYAETELGLKIQNVYLFNKVGIETEIEHLQKEIDLPVKFFSPTENPAQYIALGASQRKFGHPEATINFVPLGSGGRYNENLIVRSVGLWTGMIAMFAAAMVLVFAGFYVFLRGQRLSLQEDSGRIIARYEEELAGVADAITEARAFNAAATAARAASGSETRYAHRAAFVLEQAAQKRITILDLKKPADRNVFIATVRAPTRDALLALKTAMEGTPAVTAAMPPPAAASAQPSAGTTRTELTVTETPTGFLNVRSGPGTSYGAVGKVYPGETYTVEGSKNGWHRITLSDGSDGWVIGTYAELRTITKEAPVEEVSVTPAPTPQPEPEEAVDAPPRLITEVRIPVLELAKETDLVLTIEFVF